MRWLFEGSISADKVAGSWQDQQQADARVYAAVWSVRRVSRRLTDSACVGDEEEQADCQSCACGPAGEWLALLLSWLVRLARQQDSQYLTIASKQKGKQAIEASTFGDCMQVARDHRKTAGLIESASEREECTQQGEGRIAALLPTLVLTMVRAHRKRQDSSSDEDGGAHDHQNMSAAGSNSSSATWRAKRLAQKRQKRADVDADSATQDDGDFWSRMATSLPQTRDHIKDSVERPIEDKPDSDTHSASDHPSDVS